MMQPSQKYLEIANILAPAVKFNVRMLVPIVITRTNGLNHGQAIQQTVKNVLRGRFQTASEEQLQPLMFYLLALILLQGQKDDKAPLGDIGESDRLRLQMLMEQKSPFEQMISNLLRASSDVASGAVIHLKT